MAGIVVAVTALTLAACGPAAVVPPPGGTSPGTPAAPSPGAEAPGRPVDPVEPTPGEGAPTDNDDEDITPAGEATLRRLGSWTQSPFQNRERRVIRDQAGLDRVWMQLGAEGHPTVNWESEVVVLVASGQQRSGGHGVAVSRASVDGGRLTIEVETETPGASCVTTAALTQPAELVVIRAPEARDEPVFTDRQITREC